MKSIHLHLKRGLAAVFMVTFLFGSAFAGTLTRISVAGDGSQGNAPSTSPCVSADGRYVVFSSEASNFVPDDTNAKQDVFLYDRQTGQIELISVASNGIQGNGDSDISGLGGYKISADGRYVVFQSSATNLVPNDTNGEIDAFVRDRLTGQTSRVSVASDGTQANNISVNPKISPNGRYVAFYSLASSLSAEDVNQVYDVYLHDRDTGQTILVTQRSGVQYSAILLGISADGNYLAIRSQDATLASGGVSGEFNTYSYNIATAQFTFITLGSAHSFSSNVQYVAYTLDGGRNVFVLNRDTSEIDDASITYLEEPLNNPAGTPSISADGRFVVFTATASNLVPGDINAKNDVFLRDRQLATTTCLSVNGDDVFGNDASQSSSMSADGRFVVFESKASNLVPNDTNGYGDIFLYDRGGEGGCVPDLLARESDAPEYLGNNIFGMPEMQTATADAAPGQAATFDLLLQNDGDAAADVTVLGEEGGDGWTVRYFEAGEGGDDLTAAVTGGGWTAAALAPAGPVALRVTVQPNATVPVGASKTVLITATNATDPTRTDTVRVSAVKAPLTVSLSTDLPSGQAAGTPITLTADSNGAGLAYQFFVHNGTAWTTLQAYGPAATCPWTPAVPGVYTLLVWAREIGGLQHRDAYTTIRFQVGGAPLTAVALAVNPPAPSVAGTPLTLTATPTGGVNAQYRFFVYRGTWIELRGYGADATCPYTPVTAGDYQFMVWARDAGSPNSRDAYATLRYTVTGGAPLTGVSISSTPGTVVEVGQPVQLTATPTGGNLVEYRFFYCLGVGGSWTQIRPYGLSNTVTFTTNIPGDYTLLVWAREVGHAATYDVFTKKRFTFSPIPPPNPG